MCATVCSMALRMIELMLQWSANDLSPFERSNFDTIGANFIESINNQYRVNPKM